MSVIVVSHNGRELLEQCLASLEEDGARTDREVIVVDNASADGAPEMVAERFPEVRLVRSGTNGGFAAGNNLGMSEAHGRFLLLLNPDAAVLPGALDALVAHAGLHPEAGVVAPRIVDPDGTLQYSLRRFPTISSELAEALMLHRLLRRLGVFAGEVCYDDARYALEHEVDWASGAALLVRREAVERVGGLDEEFFLYSEEKDWCLRMREAGWAVRYTPSATVVHRRPGSDADSPSLFAQLVKSRALFFRKHHSAAASAAYRAALALGLGLRTVAWSVFALGSPPRARVAAGRARAYAGGLLTAAGLGPHATVPVGTAER